MNEEQQLTDCYADTLMNVATAIKHNNTIEKKEIIIKYLINYLISTALVSAALHLSIALFHSGISSTSNTGFNILT